MLFALPDGFGYQPGKEPTEHATGMQRVSKLVFSVLAEDAEHELAKAIQALDFVEIAVDAKPQLLVEFDDAQQGRETQLPELDLTLRW